MGSVVISGLPGKMAADVAALVMSDGRFHLAPFGLSGERAAGTVWRGGAIEIELIAPHDHHRFITLLADLPTPIVIDFTTPTAALPNIKLYCDLGVPFVIGTSGFDPAGVTEMVESSGVCAVIAPNMSLQIVALQAMIEYAAESFPGLFSGYTLDIRESHQSGKRDTSGTAKAFVRSFNRLGVPYEAERIEKIRDPEKQRSLGVPEEALAGHAWHSYALASADQSVAIRLEHNVSGRRSYSEGTIRAVEFLARRVAEGRHGEIYSMIDVARELVKR